MKKIFRYELRRLLLNKLFGGILATTLFYGWLTLNQTTILGVANTAPFSPWSFGHYLAQMLPMICLGELFFIGLFAADRTRRVSVLMEATPAPPQRYAAVRCGTVMVGAALLSLCAAAMAMGFYIRLFGWISWGDLLAPAVLALLPPIVFCLGLGQCLGRLHPSLVYAAMAVPFLLSWLPLPQAMDFSLALFFQHYPTTCGTLDPAFTVTTPILINRLAYLALGALLFLWDGRRPGVRPKRAAPTSIQPG